MSLSMVDLRSDTVTRPTRAMRQAMAAAEVGDDVFGDDPTVRMLEERVAALAGKEAAVYVPSGTMGNQIAVMSQTEPGDEVLLEEESHIFLYEQGGVATNAGCLTHVVPSDRGAVDPERIRAAVREEDEHNARLRLLCLENTHNRHGGAVVPLETLRAASRSARERGLSVHLDGARLWNASVASGVPVKVWAAETDTVMMCFSKGLGAPVGSILVGERDRIARARRHRKRLGGGMRQAGVLAAACLHALDHHVERLADDHRRARSLSRGLADIPGLRVSHPETNIVFVDLDDDALDLDEMDRALEHDGVRLLTFGPRRFRAITHLDVDDAGIARAVEAVRAVAARAG